MDCSLLINVVIWNIYYLNIFICIYKFAFASEICGKISGTKLGQVLLNLFVLFRPDLSNNLKCHIGLEEGVSLGRCNLTCGYPLVLHGQLIIYSSRRVSRDSNPITSVSMIDYHGRVWPGYVEYVLCHLWPL